MINIQSILKKTKNFSQTKQGQEKVKKLREKAFDNNKKFGKKLNPDGIVSKNDFSRNARKYLSILQFYGLYVAPFATKNDGLSQIIQETINHATVSRPIKNKDGSYVVKINFKKSLLKRPSLISEKVDEYGDFVSYPTGAGIKNILALFNNGYKISEGKSIPYGTWESHGIKVRAKPERQPLRFMQETLKEFMSLNKDRFNIQSADINDKYKE